MFDRDAVMGDLRSLQVGGEWKGKVLKHDIRWFTVKHTLLFLNINEMQQESNSALAN